MKSGSVFTVAATLATLFLISGSGVAMASTTTYNLLLSGGFVNVGSQEYHSKGHAATYVSINGQQIPASLTKFEYSIDAQVNGLSVSGEAQFTLSAPNLNIKAEARLVDMIPAVALPLSCDQATLAGCTSAVPGFYVGMGVITVNGAPVSPTPVPIVIESAYLNPFGNPIFVGTPDGSISVASKYDTAISVWENVQTGGVVTDSSGSPLGQLAMTSGLTENLLSAKETDHGQIVLSGFTGPYSVLNAAGEFHGRSTIPTAGSFDCTAATNALLALLPGFSSSLLPPGTCTATGSISTGTFNLQSQSNQNGNGNGNNQSSDTKIKGTYNTMWSVPAFVFTSTVTATVTQN
jgi:hypothetical protein